MSAIEEVCPVCKNTNGEHLPGCSRSTPKEWNDKPRIGRPANPDGHKYKIIGVSGTPAEIDAVLEGLTPRQRMEAMLEALEAKSNDPDWMPPPIYACTCGRGAEVAPQDHAESCEVYQPF